MEIHEIEDVASTNDLLEPKFYPDPSLIRVSLAHTLTIHEQEMITQITSNKATLRAIAPYLQVLARSQKIKVETKVTRRPRTPPKIIFERKSEEHSGRVIPDVLGNPELLKSVQETAETLKKLIRSNRFEIYFIDNAKNELIQFSTKKKFEIKPDLTMAGFAAYTKLNIVSDDVRTDHRFPLGIGIKETTMKFGLCVPIKTPDDSVVALFELNRDIFDINFDKHDLEIMMVITSWMGVAIFQHLKYTNLVLQKELSYCLQNLILHYHCNKTNFVKAISDVVVLAREIICAEECFLYVAVKSHRASLIVEEYAENPADANLLLKKLRRIQLEPDDTVLSRVLMKKEIVNISGDVNELCVPVLCTCNKSIGAIWLKTKKFLKEIFDEEDEKTLQLFANHVSLIILFSNKVDKLKIADCYGDAVHQMLFHHIKPSSHEREAIKQRSEHLPEHFFTFSWYPCDEVIPRLSEYTVHMFNEVLGASFMLTNNVPRFVLEVKNCYRPNPYHNFLHAFAVTHTMANIVKNNHYIFTGIERQALMVASLCHDLDHRGYNNSFVQLTKHYLSNLYETSPLENHHFTVAKMIIEHCSMFRYLRKDIYNQLIEEIRKCILATDLSFYFQTRTELVKIADSKEFSFKRHAHRRLIKSLLMTACDLSGQSKHIDISMQITQNVYEEFFRQGDVEKKMGYIPLPTMDRERDDTILDNQIQFLNVIVIPCVEIVTRIFDSVSEMLEDTKETLNRWKELLYTERYREPFIKWKESIKNNKYKPRKLTKYTNLEI